MTDTYKEIPTTELPDDHEPALSDGLFLIGENDDAKTCVEDVAKVILNDYKTTIDGEEKTIKEAISDKVDKVESKVLSTNDFTNSDKQKLDDLTTTPEWDDIANKPELYNKEETNVELAKKVNKVDGKGLSANDFTDEDKQKLSDIETGAQKNPEKYDVSKLDGVIPIEHIPPAALERLKTVADDDARFALTISDIQTGDTVKVASTGLMYLVVDDTKLDSEEGYEEYTAGSASSVPWTGITGKPDLVVVAGTGENSAMTKMASESSGNCSFAEGSGTKAQGDFSHAEGGFSTASGNFSHAEANSTASGMYAHAEGNGTKANKQYSHSEGTMTQADGEGAHAEGGSTIASGMYSHAEGDGSKAEGKYSHAEGSSSTSGLYSHAEGSYAKAASDYSHAEGNWTVADGQASHVEGTGDYQASDITYTGGVKVKAGAHGMASHAEGYQTVIMSNDMAGHAEGYQTRSGNTTGGQPGNHAEGYKTAATGGGGSHSEGDSTVASGSSSHAEGYGTSASGSHSHAEGTSSIASGFSSHAEGIGGKYTVDDIEYDSKAEAEYSHTEGYQTIVYKNLKGSHAEGYQTRVGNPNATGDPLDYAAHAEGYRTLASGYSSHAEGEGTIASHVSAHAEGLSTTASGANAHAEGSNTTASGSQSHAEGNYSTASGDYSHAEGNNTTASELYAHSEGNNTKASNDAAHAEGNHTEASGEYSHAEGSSTTASGQGAHAEGSGTTASAYQSHAEGSGTTASGFQSHAEGFMTTASGQSSHAEGQGTKAKFLAQHVFGEYNQEDPSEESESYHRGNYVEIVGNGTANNARSNARTLDWDGNETITGDLIFGTDQKSLSQALADLALKNGNVYGAIWDTANAKCVRSRDCKDITTDTTNFTYNGSINPNYNNPFDSLYPWSEVRQCNVDLDIYRSLTSADSIRDAIIAWEGDPDFATDGSNGFVGRYVPDFYYGCVQDEDTGAIEMIIATTPIHGLRHHKESIRSIGFAVDDGAEGVTATDGLPLTNISIKSIHDKAKACGMTLDNIYDHIAESIIMPAIEFATLNIQNAIGDGCSALYRANDADRPFIAETGANRVVLPTAVTPFAIAGAMLDFAATKDGVVLANRRVCTGYEAYDGTHVSVTFAGDPLDITTTMYVSFRGRNSDGSIGSKSGYVGTTGKVNAWYRGAIIHANRWTYLLGMYRETGTNHVWYADPNTYDDYDALDKNVHHDSGVALATTNGYIKLLMFEPRLGGIVPACTEVGGNDQNSVGDYHYINVNAGNTIALVGGTANGGRWCGPLYVNWGSGSSSSGWSEAAFLRLKSKALGF